MTKLINKRIFGSWYKDFIYNFLGFILIVISQQVIIMPYISRINKLIFGNCIIVFTIINLFSYVTGSALGNTLLVRFEDYKRSQQKGDFGLFFILIIPLAFVIGVVIEMFSGINGDDYGIVTVLLILFAWRAYSGAVLRLCRNNNGILLQGLLYLIGSLYVVSIDLPFENIYTLLFLPEVLAALIYIMYFKMYKEYLSIKITSNFITTFKTFCNFSVQTLFNNFVAYVDRFLVIPLLGKEYLVTLFAITVISKCTAILVNPLKNIILANLAHCQSNDKENILSELIYKTKVVAILIFLITLCVSYLSLYILYNAEFYNGWKLVPLVALSASFASFAGVYQIMAMKFLDSNIVTYISICRLFIFIVLVLCFTRYFSLSGFVCAIALTDFIVLSIYYVIVKNTIFVKEKI